jgi:hypothetical protein
VGGFFAHRQSLSLRYLEIMTTQFLTDEQGERVAVVIPVSDFEGLLEDIEDLAAAAERRDEETISLEELKNRLKADGLLSD